MHVLARAISAGLLLGAAGAPGRCLLRGAAGERGVSGAAVDCKIAAPGKRLVMLTSSGLGTYGPDDTVVPNHNLTAAFRELVLRLPDEAWGAAGAGKKQLARTKDFASLAPKDFREPDLYGELDVVIIEDMCFLKESFWNEDDGHFDVASGVGLNYKLANMTTDVSVVRPFLGKGYLDGGWCVNWAADRPGYLGGLGFDPEKVRHLSLWDVLAPEDFKTSIFEREAGGVRLIQKATSQNKASSKNVQRDAARQVLTSADVIIVNGGNTDFGSFILQQFAPDLMAPVWRRVAEGSVIFLGDSAGSILGSADIGLTFESGPVLLGVLMNGETRGLGLTGKCAIRPHDKGDTWDLASAVYGALKGLSVVRVSDGNALRCIGAECSIVGVTALPGASVFSGPEDPRLQRLSRAFVPPPI
mmetsp:Transcript_5124/g.14268  ORF Transcript_5124/g.14268 Transcript_5124/m.14268 type:complete len:415 (-) Transcript_5124:73-1317(-)